MGREGVAKGMGIDAAAQVGVAGIILLDSPDRFPDEPAALGADENEVDIGVAPSTPDVVAERLDGPPPHGHDAFLGSFAEAAEIARVEVEIVELERRDLG